MIYFIQDGRDGTIKIGTSRNPWERLAALTVASPGKMTILAVMDGDRLVERALHKQFAPLRVSGEWFRDEPDLLSFIDKAKAEHPQHRREEALRPEKRSAESELAAILSDKPHWLLEMELGCQLDKRRRLGLPSPSSPAELLDSVNVAAEMRTMRERIEYLIAVIDFRRRHGYPIEGMADRDSGDPARHPAMVAPVKTRVE